MLSKPDLVLASLTFRSQNNRTKDCSAKPRPHVASPGLTAMPVAIVAQRACRPVKAWTTNCLQQAQGGLCRACPTIQTVILLAMGDFFADPIVQMRIGALITRAMNGPTKPQRRGKSR
jgi:hypothetical protein